MAKIFNRCCAECGQSFTSGKQWAEYCSTECRKEFNNRRAMRGAELYDLVMNMRFGSGQGRDKDAFNLICSLASGYHTADQKRRDGRRSYTSTKKAVAQLDRLPGVADKR